MTKTKIAASTALGVAGVFFAWHTSQGEVASGAAPVSDPREIHAAAASVQPAAPANPIAASADTNASESPPVRDLPSDHVQLQVVASTTSNMRTGDRGVIISLSPVGMMQSRIQAGRVTITHALDDKGSLLTQQTTNKFYSVSAGRIDDSRDLTSREPTSFSLWGLSNDAQALVSVLGMLELVIPDLDPNSKVAVSNIRGQFGSAIRSDVLAAADVTVTLYDKGSAAAEAANKVPGGPQEYDGGPYFGARPPLPAGFPTAKMEMNYGDIAVAIDDPNDRLIGIEIQAADGSPLMYDHRGNYHSSGIPGHPGRRFDTYHIGAALPTDARVVCWITTPKSVLRIPFQMDRLPLPTRGGGPISLGIIDVQVAASAWTTKNALDYDKAHPSASIGQTPDGTTDRIAQLWSDVPEYVAVIKGNAKYKKLPKLISSVAPAPPGGTIFPPHGLVKVVVSFFVDPAGAVEAARVLDSNNEAFNIAAVSAVLQWKFKPGETDKGPALTMVVVPFVFNPTAPLPLGTDSQPN